MSVKVKSLSGKGHQHNLDIKIYRSFFKWKKNGICIECGALDGVNLSVGRFFEEYLEWKCINIEPSPSNFKNLEQNREKSINLNLALSNKTDDMYFCENNRMAKAGKLASEEYITKYGTKNLIPIKCITYEDLVNNILIPKYGIDRIDLFILDVEGSEIEVTEGMAGAKLQPLVICSEISWCNKEIFEKVKSNLPEYDFVFNKYYNYVFRRKI